MSPEDGPLAEEWVPPPQHFAPPPRTSAGVPMAAVTAPAPHRATAPGRTRTVVVAAAVIALLAAVGLAVTSRDEKRPGPLFVALPTVPPVTVEPSGPSPAASPEDRPAPPATTRVRDVVPPPRTPAGSPVRSTSAAPAVVLPVVGQELGLEPVGERGRRVRHRDFVARIDPVGPASRELDRADSRFTARAGRGDAACLSFESYNYPGYFLRSRESALRLERADGSRGYDADATFCAVPAGDGGFVLRSRSAPDRYVTESDAVLSLNRVTPAAAQAFVTRPPL
ncbi:AbfB domain-containing protein [Actinoplanes sp. NPDC048967]|uniref:AbfB domain-containing protein n=1 Tax=Actinoplanes sp. NPDC048967 TaxID=3155269 RepID=UPI003400EE5F